LITTVQHVCNVGLVEVHSVTFGPAVDHGVDSIWVRCVGINFFYSRQLILLQKYFDLIE